MMNHDGNGVHPAIIALLRELPGKGGVWNEEEQAAFFAAFSAAIKFAYPAHDQPGDEPQEEGKIP